MASHLSDLLNNPSVQAHYDLRSNLISNEKSQRSDHEFRQRLTPTATLAHQIVSKIRTEEHKTIWTSSAENGALFPGMMFNTAKTHMRDTKLWKIVSKMPKGALLHCHLAAMVDLEWVFERAIEKKEVYFSASESLVSSESRERAEFRFGFEKADGNGKGVWDQGYSPNTFVPLHEAAETFPDGGEKGFIKWAAKRCIISQTDSESHHLGVNDIWKKLVFGFSTNRFFVSS